MPSLWKHIRVDPDLLAYMPFPEIKNEEGLRDAFADLQDSSEPICYAVIANPRRLNPLNEPSDDTIQTEVLGVVFYGSISTNDRTIEIGALFAPVLQRSAAATEVHYLLLKNVFDGDSEVLGKDSPRYRRVAWKCNHLNVKSRNSALRVGYIFEGTHRQAAIVKGRTRDDDLLSMLDKEWPLNKAALEEWQGEKNWNAAGKQVQRLQDIRSEMARRL